MLRQNFTLNKQLANSEPTVLTVHLKFYFDDVFSCTAIYVSSLEGIYVSDVIQLDPTGNSEAPPCAVPSTSTPARGVGDSCGV